MRERYAYEDSSGPHEVSLAGFAHETYDARSACVAAVDTNLSTEQSLKEMVSGYQGLGAPVLFTCCREKLLWWSFTTQKPVHQGTFSADKVPNLFRKCGKDFAPNKIYRAKNLGRLYDKQQLHFVDAGLMQPLEDEMGERLGKLMHRVLNLLREGFTEKQRTKKENQHWIFRAGFWLLCAKILQDKSVKNFKRLNINDIDAVIYAVATHYGAREQVKIETQKKRRVLENAANEVGKFPSLQNLTTEAFGYMYENVFVDADLRVALGIHGTPSYLVDYIVWQLWPWIERIPEDKRVVLEPACGHAPFLTGAMRVLRELFSGDIKEFHIYAKRQLRGIEVDPFAREIARLSLTLADVPNPNGWKLLSRDVYEESVLTGAARKATILLCNPPFQNFSEADKAYYRKKGVHLEYNNKAVEILCRTLPYMPHGSVFGIVLPRGFLDSKNATPLRKMMTEEFQLSEICLLSDKVFEFADHESAVILGRKQMPKKTQKTQIVRVREKDHNAFKERYAAPRLNFEQVNFRSPNFSLFVPELNEIWEYCKSFPRLGDVADVGKGFDFRGKDIKNGVIKFDTRRFRGGTIGFKNIEKNLKITDLPKEYYLNLSSDAVKSSRRGTTTGTPQVLLNYAPVGRGPWRVKALIDEKGHPFSSSFLVARPQNTDWTLWILWGILNSPFANAYVYCHSTKRTIGTSRIKDLPTPKVGTGELYGLDRLVRDYFALYTAEDSLLIKSVSREEAQKRLLAVDAEVLRLYDLPPRLEKQLLDLFSECPRKGVDFKFDRYYPKGFGSYIPLHMFISEEFQNSTVENVSKWVEQNRTPDAIKAFDNAVRSFEDD